MLKNWPKTKKRLFFSSDHRPTCVG